MNCARCGHELPAHAHQNIYSIGCMVRLCECRLSREQAFVVLCLDAARPKQAGCTHAEMVTRAVVSARLALESARITGRRTDCLTGAVRDLEGALTNVRAEDEEAEGKERE